MTQIKQKSPYDIKLERIFGTPITRGDIITQTGIIVLDEYDNSLIDDLVIGKGLFDKGFVPKTSAEIKNIEIPVEYCGRVISTFLFSLKQIKNDVLMSKFNEHDGYIEYNLSSNEYVNSVRLSLPKYHTLDTSDISVYGIDSDVDISEVDGDILITPITDKYFIPEDVSVRVPIIIEETYPEPEITTSENSDTKPTPSVIDEEESNKTDFDLETETGKVVDLDFFGSVDDEAGTAEGDEFDDIGEEPSLTKTKKNKRVKKEKKPKKPKTPKVKNGEKKGGGIIKNILLYLSVLLALGGVLGGGLYGYKLHGENSIKTTTTVVDKQQDEVASILKKEKLTAADVEKLSQLVNTSQSKLSKIKSTNPFALQKRNSYIKKNNDLVKKVLDRTNSDK